MNNNLKRKIGRAVKEAARRRHLSVAMKESWRRRRETMSKPISIYDLDPKPTSLTHVYTDEDLLAVAITLIGRENVRTLLTQAIKGVLL
jgi:hypothetical protein